MLAQTAPQDKHARNATGLPSWLKLNVTGAGNWTRRPAICSAHSWISLQNQAFNQESLVDLPWSPCNMSSIL